MLTYVIYFTGVTVYFRVKFVDHSLDTLLGDKTQTVGGWGGGCEVGVGLGFTSPSYSEVPTPFFQTKGKMDYIKTKEN